MERKSLLKDRSGKKEGLFPGMAALLPGNFVTEECFFLVPLGSTEALMGAHLNTDTKGISSSFLPVSLGFSLAAILNQTEQVLAGIDLLPEGFPGKTGYRGLSGSHGLHIVISKLSCTGVWPSK